MAPVLEGDILPEFVACERCHRVRRNMKCKTWWFMPCRKCGNPYARYAR